MTSDGFDPEACLFLWNSIHFIQTRSGEVSFLLTYALGNRYCLGECNRSASLCGLRDCREELNQPYAYSIRTRDQRMSCVITVGFLFSVLLSESADEFSQLCRGYRRQHEYYIGKPHGVE